MEHFVYYTPTKVYFGKGEEKKVGTIIKGFSPRKVMLVYGGGSIKKIGLYDIVIDALTKEGIDFVELGGVQANPEVSLVYEGIRLGLEAGVDFVLAVGGGSVLDTAKDIAHGIADPDVDVWEFHSTKRLPEKTLRKGAILTLSAAGSEMSNSCVMTNAATKVKHGFASDLNRFDFAIENPELTYSVSKYQTACGIVDIAMHTMERFFSVGDVSDLTDNLALGLIKNTFDYGKIAYENPTDYNARAELMWASSIAHNGLTGMGRKVTMPVHQMEHELSALKTDIAHGAGLAALWASWARYVCHDAQDRFVRYAHDIWGIEGDGMEAALEAILRQEDYYKAIGMPTSLEELGILESDLEYLALRCSYDKSRVIGGYKPIGYQEMLDIYRLAFPKR